MFINSHFNSIKVRLELIFFAAAYSVNMNFNSIKVRLERKKIPRTRRKTRFQFHKGTIRTPRKRILISRKSRISIP